MTSSWTFCARVAARMRLHAALLVERGADEQHAQRPVAAGLRRGDGGADRRAERRHLVRDAVTDDVQQPVAGRVRPRQQVLAAVVEDGAPESLARPRPGQRELLVEREHAHLFEIDHVGLRRIAQHELGAVDEVHVVGDPRRREPHVAGAGERAQRRTLWLWSALRAACRAVRRCAWSASWRRPDRGARSDSGTPPAARATAPRRSDAPTGRREDARSGPVISGGRL